MCSICRQSPCASGCPNADEPPTVYYCCCCEEPIVVGEDYYFFEDEYYHEDCLRENAFDILTESSEILHGTAECEV
ncbi:MAG: hypothetical protein ACLUFN_11485 [Eubacterium sp.]